MLSLSCSPRLEQRLRAYLRLKPEQKLILDQRLLQLILALLEALYGQICELVSSCQDCGQKIPASKIVKAIIRVQLGCTCPNCLNLYEPRLLCYQADGSCQEINLFDQLKKLEKIEAWQSSVKPFLGKLPDTTIAKYVRQPPRKVRKLRQELRIFPFTRESGCFEAKIQQIKEKYDMNCHKCLVSANWRIVAQSKRWGKGQGGIQRNLYACDEHKDGVAQTIRDEMTEIAKESGNPFFVSSDKEMDIFIVPFRR